MNAPMAHSSVIAMFRDAQYKTFFDVNKFMKKVLLFVLALQKMPTQEVTQK
jgi:hypothetical protein